MLWEINAARRVGICARVYIGFYKSVYLFFLWECLDCPAGFFGGKFMMTVVRDNGRPLVMAFDSWVICFLLWYNMGFRYLYCFSIVFTVWLLLKSSYHDFFYIFALNLPLFCLIYLRSFALLLCQVL